MKYKAVYDVLNERRQTTPGFCYHDRSGWRAYSQTYMTMQCPLYFFHLYPFSYVTSFLK